MVLEILALICAHDFFNLCAVIVLLPLQMQFNLIGVSAEWLQDLFQGFVGMKFSSPLGAITKPVSHLWPTMDRLQMDYIIRF